MSTLSYDSSRSNSKLDQLREKVNSRERLTTPEKANLFILVGVVLLMSFFGLVAQYSIPLDAGMTGSASALAIITAAAVGIERAIETFWTYIGLTRGSWWPLGPVREQLDGLISGLDASFEPFYQEAHAKMHKLQEKENWGQEKLDAAAQDLDRIKKHVEELRKLPIDSQRVQLIAASATRSVEYFSKKYPEVKGAAELAGLGIHGITDFVETFKDNPGRRLISLLAGALAGLIIAGFVGLDIFQAVLQAPASPQQRALLPHVGVAITGLLMGLGANPTHEAIRLLQEIKHRRKTVNII